MDMNGIIIIIITNTIFINKFRSTKTEYFRVDKTVNHVKTNKNGSFEMDSIDCAPIFSAFREFGDEAEAFVRNF